MALATLRHFRYFVLTALFLTVMCLLATPSPQPGALTGRWEWRGPAGWQRLVLNLTEKSGKVTGTVVYGPGPGGGNDRETYWEFFFTPVTYPIRKGTYNNGEVRIEHNFAGTRYTYAGTGSPIWGQTVEDPGLKFTFSGRVEGDRLVLTRESSERFDVTIELRHQRRTVVLRRAPSPLLVSEEYIPPRERSRPVPARIRFSVRDSSGNFATRLQPQDFLLSAGNRSLEIRNFVRAESAWNIALVYDADKFLLGLGAASGGVTPAGIERARELWTAVGSAATKLDAELRAQDQMSILAFYHDQTATLMDWRRGAEKSAMILKPLELGFSYVAGPYGDLHEAVRRALAKLSRTEGHKVIVLMTDGDEGRLKWGYLRTEEGLYTKDPLWGLPDAAEEEEFDDLLREVRQSGVSIYVVLVQAGSPVLFGGLEIEAIPGSARAISDYVRLLDSRMSEVAEASGGAVIYRGDLLGAASFPGRLAEVLGVGRTYSVEPGLNPAIGTAEPVRLRLAKQEGWEIQLR